MSLFPFIFKTNPYAQACSFKVNLLIIFFYFFIYIGSLIKVLSAFFFLIPFTRVGLIIVYLSSFSVLCVNRILEETEVNKLEENQIAKSELNKPEENQKAEV